MPPNGNDPNGFERGRNSTGAKERVSLSLSLGGRGIRGHSLRGIVSSPTQIRGWENAKQSGQAQGNPTPTPRENIALKMRHLNVISLYSPPLLCISQKCLPLEMSWELSIHNRISIGFCLGWSWYGFDDEFRYSEFVLFAGLFSLNLKIYQ